MRVLINCGKAQGALIEEAPDDVVFELANRFPLAAAGLSLSDPATLAVTVAVHEELRRRRAGGTARPPVPTVREFAQQVVAEGYDAVLARFSGAEPDEARRRLQHARDMLQSYAGSIEPGATGEFVSIGPPGQRPQRVSKRKIKSRRPPQASPAGQAEFIDMPPWEDPRVHGITDEDVPF